MNVCLRFPKLSLAILMCIAFQSCSKDTDLISEYVIRDAEKIEYSIILSNDDFKGIATAVITQEIKVAEPANGFVVHD
ncbi:hypothetical protein [uncultured Maribacter sp.]|uniref:hypothetical protein n=1 Tax=uncultured Maribacter sp. TaxID=431308 RepID=UPI0030EC4CBE|tara:strand:+ start:60432 stop:60665 length:234 start_codon:yes stop_codon:yes gene_type:complete